MQLRILCTKLRDALSMPDPDEETGKVATNPAVSHEEDGLAVRVKALEAQNATLLQQIEQLKQENTR